MAINVDRVKERLLFIRTQVGALEPLSRNRGLLRQRMRDPLTFSGIVRNLQTSIEAMIDIAFHLCAKLYAREPQSAANAFEILAERGDVPAAFIGRALEMVRFRNLVVHGYLQTSPDAVESIVSDELGDFSTWEKIVVEILRRADR